MFQPCKDYCFVRHGKQYSVECDTTCDYAAEVKKNKELKGIIMMLATALKDARDAIQSKDLDIACFKIDIALDLIK